MEQRHRRTHADVERPKLPAPSLRSSSQSSDCRHEVGVCLLFAARWICYHKSQGVDSISAKSPAGEGSCEPHVFHWMTWYYDDNEICMKDDASIVASSRTHMVLVFDNWSQINSKLRFGYVHMFTYLNAQSVELCRIILSGAALPTS